MWWRVQKEFSVFTTPIRSTYVAEQNEGKWVFYRTFKTKPPKRMLTVIGHDGSLMRAVADEYLVPIEEPAWAKALYRPTSWEHLGKDPFEGLV